MLEVNKGKSTAIKDHTIDTNGIWFKSEAALLFVGAISDSIVHIRYTTDDIKERKGYSFVTATELDPQSHMELSMKDKHALIKLKNLTLKINRSNSAITFMDADGNILLRPDEENPFDLDRYELFTADDNDMKVEKIKTPDGIKEKIIPGSQIFERYSYRCRYSVKFDDNENLYGLGQFEDGYGSLRGQRLYLHQANRRIIIPYMISTRGYGLLFNMHSPMIFNDTAAGSYIYTTSSDGIDLYFVNGGNISGAQRAYRYLTDKAAILPKWAYGYMQSQERYETQEEILKVAKEYRDRGIGLDTMILDWCSWPDGQWGQKSFDVSRFPDPKGMIRLLHEMNTHFMISIWPNMNESTADHKEFKDKGLLLKHSDTYNAFDPEARKLYWKQTDEGLYLNGVDGWWCDNSEPFDPSWTQMVKPDPAKHFDDYVEETSRHMDPDYSNTYAYFHAMGVYEGQREENAHIINDNEYDPLLWDKRVINLTRSAYLGSQKFGTILWSGDIDAKWSVLRKQIAAGLNFCAAGMPYWTLDIGAFFVKKGDFWYWNGEYDRGFDDEKYRELFVRWYWFGAFLPIVRGHGTDVRRELYYCKNGKRAYYDSLIKANKLRYELFYYIYSYAGRCYVEDENIMNPLAVDFSTDERACAINDQYMFGHELMICPVYEPIEDGKKTVSRRIYLPEGSGWYDYMTKCRLAGGQYIDVDVPIDSIPIYVRDGSIIPRTNIGDLKVLSVETLKKEIELDVYGNGNRGFLFYDDAGDGYGYESGQYQLKNFEYDSDNDCIKETIVNDGYETDIKVTHINLI